MGNYVPNGNGEAFVVQSDTIKVTAANGTQTTMNVSSQMPYQAPAAAADVAALKIQFDALLAKLVTAKLMAAS